MKARKENSFTRKKKEKKSSYFALGYTNVAVNPRAILITFLVKY